MHEIIWEFQPAPNRERDFEAAYGPNGAWVDLFRRAEGYLGTELTPPAQSGAWYRTVDRWESVEHYERFRRAWSAEYAALDQACSSLTARERAVSSGPSPREIS